VVFVGVNTMSLMKLDFGKRSETKYFQFPKNFTTEVCPDIVNVKDMIYVISHHNFQPALRLNISQLNWTWEEIEWKNEYKNRRYIAYKDSILAIGLKPTEDIKATMLGSNKTDIFNATTGEWTRLPDMKVPRMGHALALFKGLVCAIGGSLPSDAVECFNRTTNQWTHLTFMGRYSRYASAIELNEELYVIGGVRVSNYHYSDNRATIIPTSAAVNWNSVTKYNTAKNWTEVASLNQERMHHTAGVFDGKIFVIGGMTNVMETYDPTLNMWRKVVDNVNYAEKAIFLAYFVSNQARFTAVENRLEKNLVGETVAKKKT